MGRKKASRLLEEKASESRQRFAEDALRAQHSTSQESTRAPWINSNSTVSSPSSRSSLLPPNFTLTPIAAAKLTEMYDLWVSDKVATPPSLLEVVQLIVALEPHALSFTEEDRKKKLPGMKVPTWDDDLIQAVMELEDASMDSLSPKLQFLKLGFEQIQLDPHKPKGIERRDSEALRAGGEPADFNTVYSDWRIDRSSIPPTRVQKTHRDRLEETMAREKSLKSLRRRKPKVHASVMAILAEEFSFMPTSGGHAPERLPSGRMSQKVSEILDLYA